MTFRVKGLHLYAAQLEAKGVIHKMEAILIEASRPSPYGLGIVEPIKAPQAAISRRPERALS